MPTAPDRSVSELDKQRAHLVLQLGNEWHLVSEEVRWSVETGLDPSQMTSEFKRGGEPVDMLRALHDVAESLSMFTRPLYAWFDTERPWKAWERAKRWSEGNRSQEEAIDLCALLRSVNGSVFALQDACMRDLGMLPKTPSEPVDTYSAIYAYLIHENLGKPASLFWFMRDRNVAAYEDIIEQVYEKRRVEFSSIVSIVKRLNKALAKCQVPSIKDHARRIRFSRSGLDYTISKHIKP